LIKFDVFYPHGLTAIHIDVNPLGTKVYLGSLRCSDMPWHLYFFQLLTNILMAQVKLHSI